MNGPPRDDLLVWIDLEMTGLDPVKDTILEIAAIVTTQNLDLLEVGPHLIIHREPGELDRMSDVVRKMHEKNGLLELVRSATLEADEAEHRLLSFVQRHCKPRSSPLCGNSVWTDRMFLNRQMPSVDQYLHHRVIDVSTLKELVRRWWPSHYQAAPAKPDRHRAFDDIRASIDELKHYRAALFAKAPTGAPAAGA